MWLNLKKIFFDETDQDGEYCYNDVQYKGVNYSF